MSELPSQCVVSIVNRLAMNTAEWVSLQEDIESIECVAEVKEWLVRSMFSGLLKYKTSDKQGNRS